MAEQTTATPDRKPDIELIRLELRDIWKIVSILSDRRAESWAWGIDEEDPESDED